MDGKGVFERRYVLGMRVDATSYHDATRRVLEWAWEASSRYVCVANVHMVMEAYDSPRFREIVNSADLVTPNGMPLVWMLRRLGISRQGRVYGPDLSVHLCEAAAREGVAVGFYGGSPEALEWLVANLQERVRGLKITFSFSPPFRSLTSEEDEAITQDIVASGARILFVGLGCPRQERWMVAHKGRIPAVMVGVGAAFDFLSGRVKQAPRSVQALGLEWLFRLAMEPRRLWVRYLKHNPRFVLFVIMDLIGLRRFMGV